MADYIERRPVKEDFEKRCYATEERLCEVINNLKRKEEIIDKLRVQNEILVEEIMRLRARYEQ